MSWAPEANIKGQKGDKGDRGDPGPPGASGAGTGNVNGPPGATPDHIATYNGNSGTVIRDGGKLISELAPVVHTHTASQITDFAEAVDDRAAVLIQNGTGITWSYNDTAGTLTPTVTVPSYTDEQVDDRVAALIQNGTGITWAYDDAANTLTPTVTVTGGGGAASGITFAPGGTNLVATNVQTAIVELDNEKLAIDGTQNMTGDLTINKVDPTLYLRKTSGTSGLQANRIGGYTGFLGRWSISLGDQTAEIATGNTSTGSDFKLYRYDDNGAMLAAALAINRASGIATLTAPLLLPNVAPTNALEATTKQYVDGSIRAPATATPLVELGSGAVGTSVKYAREDHVHPAAAGGGGGTAASVTFTPVGNISGASTNVQLAIAEVDAEKVALAGDRMTGALRVGAAFSATPWVAALSANNISADVGFGFNAFISASGTQWLAQTAGYGAVIQQAAGSGLLTFSSTTASVATPGTAYTLVQTASLDRTGLFIASNINAAANISATANVSAASATVSGVASLGTISVTTGGINIIAPSTTTTLGIYVAGATAANCAEFRGNAPALSAVIGWCQGLGHYGRVGHIDATPVKWSFWGSTSAFLNAGSWSTSDARVKTFTRDLDPAAALAAVNALAVKEFTPKSIAACSMFFGREDVEDDTLYGWSAQEVEMVIPIAVRDIDLPKDDQVIRAALKNIKIPEHDSDEARALGEESMSIKAINDRYMLTTLWTAVQRLSTQNDELRAEIDLLKGTA
jgi:hypothetical protein